MTRFFPNGSSTSTAEEVGENHHHLLICIVLCDVKPDVDSPQDRTAMDWYLVFG